MSYIVLARKWRPKRFAEMVGQEHVLRALANALDSGKVHHAFLFTGTRGVGKTTIARILAKSLNCETAGVSSNPCGVCAACRVRRNRSLDVDLVRPGPDAKRRLGRDDHLVATSLDRLPEDLLGHSRRVCVGGVEHGEAVFEADVDKTRGFGCVR